MTVYALRIPKDERHTAFIVNRVEGMAPVHYGDPFLPGCVFRTKRPWLTSWFIEDVTCKRCLRLDDSLRKGGRLP